MKKSPFIADETVVFRSPDNSVYCYTPSVIHVNNKRLVASFDLSGKGLHKYFPPPYTSVGDCSGNQLQIMISDDLGKTWRQTARLAMLHATLFQVHDDLYVIGHAGALYIARSSDYGETWTEPVLLNDEYRWHQSSCNMEIWQEHVYIAFEYTLPVSEGQWCWPNVMPVILSCRVDKDLLDPQNWHFGKSVSPEALLNTINPNCGKPHDYPFVLESNLIRLRQTDHEFYRNGDLNLFLIMRTTYDFGSTGAVLKACSRDPGQTDLDFVYRDDGSKFFFFPMPGGNMKFYLQYDEPSGYYWLAASQSNDYFLKSSADRLDGGPRQRLCLYFSKDCFSWCFAGLIAQGEGRSGSRHYSTFTVVGNDLYVLSRSGTAESECQHNGNMITLHRIENFRDLAY
jgi:hypothetical protein